VSNKNEGELKKYFGPNSPFAAAATEKGYELPAWGSGGGDGAQEALRPTLFH